MDSISELRHLTPRPVALTYSGYQSAKADTATADPKSVAAARPLAPASAALTAPTVPAASPAPEAESKPGSRSTQIHRRFARFETMDYADGIPDRDFEFGDLLDVINPLQHIPGVASLYRNLTGDEISDPAKILGGLLYGGPVGFVAALVTTIAEQEVGQDLGEAAYAALFDGEQTGDVLQAELPVDAVSEVIPAVTLAAADTVARPGPQAALNRINPDPASITSVEQIHAVDRTAFGDSNQSRSALSGKDALDAFVRDFKDARQAPPPSVMSDGVASDGAAIEVVPLAPLPSLQAQRAANPQLAQNARIGAIEPGPLGWAIQRRAEPAQPPAELAAAAPPANAEPPAAPLAAPLAQATEISAQAFSERMLRALDKYQAMSRAEAAKASAAALDVRL